MSTSSTGTTTSYGDDERGRGRDGSSTSTPFHGPRGNLLFTADVPRRKATRACRSWASCSTTRASRTSGSRPGPSLLRRNDTSRRDVVMMDDFLYGEPQMIEDVHMRQEIAILEEN